MRAFLGEFVEDSDLPDHGGRLTHFSGAHRRVHRDRHSEGASRFWRRLCLALFAFKLTERLLAAQGLGVFSREIGLKHTDALDEGRVSGKETRQKIISKALRKIGMAHLG